MRISSFILAIALLLCNSSYAAISTTINNVDTDFNAANSIIAVDLDQDGDIDLVGTANNADNTVDIEWWENDGTPRNGGWTEHNVDTDFNAANSIIAVDLDQDGDIDLVGTAVNADNTVDIEWWENDGTPRNGGWTERNVDTDFNAANSIIAVDLDQDGDIDLVGTANNADNTVDIEWWENDGTPRNGGWTEHNIDTDFNAANSIIAVDLDQDGDIDVIGTANNADNTVDLAWWQNDEDRQSGNIGFATEHAIDDSFNGANSVYAIDLDIDGDFDVLAVARLGDDITWWRNDGTPVDGGWTERVVDSDFDGAYGATAIDLDADGDLDIVAVAFNIDELAWWENNGSQSFTKNVIEGNFNGASSLFIIDLDTDGDLDIVATAALDDDLAWWENNGSESFTKTTIDNNVNGANSVFCADLDNDGDIDILATSDVDDDVAWWENNGSEGFTKRVIDDNFNGATSVTGKDVDLDGNIDVIASAYNSDKISWWHNDGSPSDGGWTEYTIDDNVDGASGIDLLDLDLDGDIDVVASEKEDDDLLWLENDGSPTDGGWIRHAIDLNFEGVTDVFCLDLDADGDIDVLGAAESGDDITWWENGGASAASTAPSERDEGATPFVSVDFTAVTAPTHKVTTLTEGAEIDEAAKTAEAEQEVDVRCFIATASFGTPEAPQIKRLSYFRDKYLMQTEAGRALIRLYYKISPPLAKSIQKSESLKRIVRSIIRLLIKMLPV